LAWLWIIVMTLMLVRGYFLWRRGQLLTKRVAEIQQGARLRTGAAQIGSAVHVAGHPLLTRDQPVVLALSDETLSFFSYDSAVPIDTLPIRQLQSVHTVVYDDERVPHIEVIDSAAQALQLTFTREGAVWTCLFKQMRKVRPVDWYHALQQARMLISHTG